MSHEESSMTEAEWSACAAPGDLLEHLRILSEGKLDPRRARLFACACCRALWDILPDERSRQAVEVMERHADGRATADEFEDAAGGASTVAYATRKDPFKDAAWAASNACFRNEGAWMGACSAYGSATRALAKAATKKFAERDARQAAAQARQAALVREVFGNPFRPYRVELAWLTPTVAAAARRAYEERLLPGGELDPSRLASLADALEAAGADAEIVGHLRGPGPHVRGCWAVDAALGLAAWDPGPASPPPRPAPAPEQPRDEFAPCFGGQDPDGAWSLAFTDFDGTAAAFEAMGFEGGGYGWHGVVDALVRMKAPKLRRKLQYDPEASMFAVRSKDAGAVRQVAELIRAAVHDPDLLKQAIRKADPDLMDP